MVDLAERLEFAERVIAQQRPMNRLKPLNGSDVVTPVYGGGDSYRLSACPPVRLSACPPSPLAPVLRPHNPIALKPDKAHVVGPCNKGCGARLAPHAEADDLRTGRKLDKPDAHSLLVENLHTARTASRHHSLNPNFAARGDERSIILENG